MSTPAEKLDKATALLMALEWSQIVKTPLGIRLMCPCCKGVEDTGHDPEGCRLAKLLGELP